MRPPHILAALLLAATVLTSCQPQTESPEMIVLGRLVTMDPQQPQVSAVAINNGRFGFVGDQAAALALRGPDTRVIYLEDATAYPGFIDAHLHVAGIGAAQRSVDLTGASSFSELIDRVAARASTLRPGVKEFFACTEMLSSFLGRKGCNIEGCPKWV